MRTSGIGTGARVGSGNSSTGGGVEAGGSGADVSSGFGVSAGGVSGVGASTGDGTSSPSEDGDEHAIKPVSASKIINSIDIYFAIEYCYSFIKGCYLK